MAGSLLDFGSAKRGGQHRREDGIKCCVTDDSGFCSWGGKKSSLIQLSSQVKWNGSWIDFPGTPCSQPFINGWLSIGWWTKSLHGKWLFHQTSIESIYKWLFGVPGYLYIIFLVNVFVEEQLKYSSQLDTDQQKSQSLLLGLKPRYLRFD